jgi:hypothetical protein
MNRIMSEYNHTMDQVLRLMVQYPNRSPPLRNRSPSPGPSPDFMESGSSIPTTNRPVDPMSGAHTFLPTNYRNSHIADAIMNALMQSSQDTNPLSEASFTFSLFPNEDRARDEHHDLETMTDEQFNQCTESYLYSVTEPIAEPASEPSAALSIERITTCPITLEDFVDGESVTKINVCGHVFRTSALRHWFERNCMCPVCRRDSTGAALAPV